MADSPSPSSSPAADDADAAFPAWKLVDGPRLIAALRAGDQDAISEAYRRTFAGELGQLVLAHHLMSSGHGQIEGRGVSADDRTYNAGARDAALNLMSKAGFDEASATTAILTDFLEGQTHDDRNVDRDFADDRADPDDV